MTRTLISILLLILAPAVLAQQPAIGFPAFTPFQTGSFDNVNLENLNTVFSIPIINVPGRGLNMNAVLIYCGDGSGTWSDITGRGSITSLTRVVSDGTNSGSWQYSRSLVSTSTSSWVWKTTMTAPAVGSGSADDTTYQVTINLTAGSKTIVESRYRGSATAQQTMSTTTTNLTCPNGWLPACTPSTVITVLDNNQQNKVATVYDSFSRLTQRDEYDWGSGTPGPKLRSTVTSYASLTNNILDKPAIVSMYDAGGALRAKTTFTYDEYCLSDPNPGPGHRIASRSPHFERWLQLLYRPAH